MLNDHTDAEIARREHAYEMGSESAGDRAWSRFHREAANAIIARGWDEKFTGGPKAGGSRGLDGTDDETGYSIDSAYDAFEAGWNVARYIEKVERLRARNETRDKARADGTVVKLVKGLEKTRASITAHVGRGLGLGYNGNINNRGCGLCDRYDDLREKLQALDYDAWTAYCKEHEADPSHNGHDMFA